METLTLLGSVFYTLPFSGKIAVKYEKPNIPVGRTSVGVLF